jgi:pyridoxamine 5'-phosphate oxidase family protein
MNMERSAKYRNVAIHPDVAFVIDDATGEGAAGMRFIEVRGRASQAEEPAAHPHLSSHLIRIHPRRIVSWNIDPARPGLQARDLSGT